jgi:hypothetical protein
MENTIDIRYMFLNAEFNRDLSDWKPYNVRSYYNAFEEANCPIPYWFKYDSMEERKKAIDTYCLNKELAQELEQNNTIIKKIKI